MKTKGRFFAVLVAVLFAAGCATNGGLEKLRADVNVRLAAKADKAEITAGLASKSDLAVLERRTKALSEGVNAVDVKANDAAEGIGALKKRVDRTDATVTNLQKLHSGTQGRVAALERSVDRAFSNIAALEKQVVGVRHMAVGAVARIGTLEDQAGMDHDKRMFRLTGFQAANYDAEKNEVGQSCWKISPAMQKRLDEISALLKKGEWKVSEIIGFADERPFRKGGKVLDNSDELNAFCAQFRAQAVAEALDWDVDRAVGRGVTTKFGGLEMNRSVLICLERDNGSSQAQPQQQQQQQQQPSAQGGRAASGQVQQLPPSGAAPAGAAAAPAAPAAPAAGAAAQQ